jgi:hypothetical protein
VSGLTGASLPQQFDESLLLFRRRLGWPIRQILYISLNHYRHLTPADWPPHLRDQMNSTLAPDWAFYAGARALWAAQARAYGEQRLAEEAARFGELRGLLLEACNGQKLEEYTKESFAKACVFDGRQRHCSQQKSAQRCVLHTFDRCLSNQAGANESEPLAAAPANRPHEGRLHGRLESVRTCPRMLPLVRSLDPNARAGPGLRGAHPAGPDPAQMPAGLDRARRLDRRAALDRAWFPGEADGRESHGRRPVRGRGRRVRAPFGRWAPAPAAEPYPQPESESGP